MYLQVLENGAKGQSRQYINEGLGLDERDHLGAKDLEEQGGYNPVHIAYGHAEVFVRGLTQGHAIGALPRQKDIDPVWEAGRKGGQGYDQDDENFGYCQEAFHAHSRGLGAAIL
jgi:hypothetical protein